MFYYLILILCVPESLRIRTSSAINPQSRSDRVRGKRLLDSVVPSCNWFCVFYNSARPCGLRVYPALFHFAYLLKSQRPSGCSLLESILLPWRCSFSPSASRDPDRPRLIHEAMVGVEVSAPSREWRAGFLFEVQGLRFGPALSRSGSEGLGLLEMASGSLPLY